jgi:dolichol-phosphate mannosyltransferase
MARTSGESKIIKNEMLETLKVIFLFQIHNPKILRFIKFGVVGFTGFIVNYVGLEILKKIGLSTYLATLFATEAAIISNFIFNNIWTFKDKTITKIGDIIPQFIKFNVTSLFAVIVQPLIVTLATNIFSDTAVVRLGGLVSALVIVMIYNYTVYNFFIWKTWKLPWAKKQ